MQAGDKLHRAFMVAGNGAIMTAANQANSTDAAIVDYGSSQLMRQRKALHAEQKQQQCDTHEIGPSAMSHIHHFTHRKAGEVKGLRVPAIVMLAHWADNGEYRKYEFTGNNSST